MISIIQKGHEAEGIPDAPANRWLYKLKRLPSLSLCPEEHGRNSRETGRGTQFDLRLRFSPPARTRVRIKTKLLRQMENQLFWPPTQGPFWALDSLPLAEPSPPWPIDYVPWPRGDPDPNWLCSWVSGSWSAGIKEGQSPQEKASERQELWVLMVFVTWGGSWCDWPVVGGMMHSKVNMIRVSICPPSTSPHSTNTHTPVHSRWKCQMESGCCLYSHVFLPSHPHAPMLPSQAETLIWSRRVCDADSRNGQTTKLQRLQDLDG